jgi:hypothetical protein
MLQLAVPLGPEEWDESKQEFVLPKYQILQLEHSLVSLSKWESKWCKPFLSKADKTDEEILDYIKCMTITQNVKPEIYDMFTADNFRQVNEYINAPMTATTFHEDKQSKKQQQIVTSEVIYGWMVALQIPPEYQKWHLNRLLTLIRVCNINNSPPKKMSKRATASHYAQLNAARRKQMNSRG